MKKNQNLPSAFNQGMLDLNIERQAEIDGIQMGVMSDGTAYLSGRGLAKVCGVVSSVIHELTSNWEEEQMRPRGRAIVNILQDVKYSGPLYLPIEADGNTIYAFPAEVCGAILEYYAFEAKPIREVALKNHRLLTRSSLKAFIYVQVGYDPTNRIPECWVKFHDRVSASYTAIPAGYFSVFKELADLVVSMIQGGVPVDEKTVPDISVGQHWSRYWQESELENEFGDRIKYTHNYPDYFPQAASNPQSPWAYPEAALPAFRQWMREVYLQDKFPKYLKTQEDKRALPPSVRSLALASVGLPE